MKNYQYWWVGDTASKPYLKQIAKHYPCNYLEQCATLGTMTWVFF